MRTEDRRPRARRQPAGDGGGAPAPANRRNILCVFPRYAPSFGTFEYAYRLFPDVSAFMPPQGLLLIAAWLPAEWEVRFIDENRVAATAADFAWADAVMISGMHVQRPFIEDVNARAHRHGKLTVLGGPSVSSCPEFYPEVDILHVGELGDATRAIVARIDADTGRPAAQEIYRTGDRVPLEQFPVPAYELIDVGDYFLGSIQFSSGCPFQCEFCDIPALYGRNPRLKAPAQICAELDAIVANGGRGAVYFVDDNFVGNKKAAHELLPHLVDWQVRNGYPLRFACEATLNIAKMPDLLALMREARFVTVFVGIETPEEDALLAMRKSQNLRSPILEAIETLNGYGLEVVSGIIMGLDTDTPQTGANIVRFIDQSQIPLLTINVLYALPKTALHERLAKDGRVLPPAVAARRVSNVDFKMPYEDVVRMWFDTVTTAYEPAKLLDRFLTQAQRTFANRMPMAQKANGAMIRYGLRVIGRVLWHCGVRADWRREFWRVCGPLLRQGRIEEVIHIGAVSYHLISFTRQIQAGDWEASFYAEARRGLRSGRRDAETPPPPTPSRKGRGLETPPPLAGGGWGEGRPQ
ncbi:MAG: B12-binding domain-containing radical SAM protein [Alphaproteobacteria bacterium]